jgi:guanylate kinase
MSERPDDLSELPSGQPLLIVLSGPSGAGKDSVRDLLLQWEPTMHRVVTVTTRKPRAGEVEGHDYHFIDEETFDHILETDGFIEHAFVYDHRNGVPRVEIEDPPLFGRDAIARIDVQGAATLKRLLPQALLIFISPGSVEETARRMQGRGADTEEEQKRRIEIAEREMAATDQFDYVVENRTGELAAAARRVHEILAEEKLRRAGLEAGDTPDPD